YCNSTLNLEPHEALLRPPPQRPLLSRRHQTAGTWSAACGRTKPAEFIYISSSSSLSFSPPLHLGFSHLFSSLSLPLPHLFFFSPILPISSLSHLSSSPHIIASPLLPSFSLSPPSAYRFPPLPLSLHTTVTTALSILSPHSPTCLSPLSIGPLLLLPLPLLSNHQQLLSFFSPFPLTLLFLPHLPSPLKIYNINIYYIKFLFLPTLFVLSLFIILSHHLPIFSSPSPSLPTHIFLAISLSLRSFPSAFLCLFSSLLHSLSLLSVSPPPSLPSLLHLFSGHLSSLSVFHSLLSLLIQRHRTPAAAPLYVFSASQLLVGSVSDEGRDRRPTRRKRVFVRAPPRLGAATQEAKRKVDLDRWGEAEVACHPFLSSLFPFAPLNLRFVFCSLCRFRKSSGSFFFRNSVYVIRFIILASRLDISLDGIEVSTCQGIQDEAKVRCAATFLTRSNDNSVTARATAEALVLPGSLREKPRRADAKREATAAREETGFQFLKREV
ncbi:hypothetical protein C7M84_010688, partial [Penaeus vannamei]